METYPREIDKSPWTSSAKRTQTYSAFCCPRGREGSVSHSRSVNRVSADDLLRRDERVAHCYLFLCCFLWQSADTVIIFDSSVFFSFLFFGGSNAATHTRISLESLFPRRAKNKQTHTRKGSHGNCLSLFFLVCACSDWNLQQDLQAMDRVSLQTCALWQLLFFFLSTQVRKNNSDFSSVCVCFLFCLFVFFSFLPFLS